MVSNPELFFFFWYFCPTFGACIHPPTCILCVVRALHLRGELKEITPLPRLTCRITVDETVHRTSIS